MKFVLYAVLSILKDLLVSQIKAYIPVLARMIVRHQAAKMGSHAERAKEEWAHHLETIPGELGKLFYALRKLKAPYRKAIEEWQNDLRSFWVKAGSAVRKRAWWLVVVAALVMFRAYPLEPGRYPSYFIYAIFFVVFAVSLSAAAQRVLLDLYGARTYALKLALGGLSSPLAIGLVVAVALLPPTRHLPRGDVHSPQKTVREPWVFMVDGSALSSKAAVTAAPTALPVSNGKHPMILQAPVAAAAEEAGAAIAANEKRSGPEVRDADTSFVPELPYITGFDPIALEPSPVVMTLTQPLPSPQSYPVLPPLAPPLAAPSGLRVIK